MKLNTKPLFELSSFAKATPKTKIKCPHKPKLSSPFLNNYQTLNNKANTNSNIKLKLFQTSNKNVNPFIDSSDKNENSKFVKTIKKSNIKKVKFNIDNVTKNDLFEDTSNIICLTNESDTNNNNLNKLNNGKNINENKNLFNLFNKNVLKSTIIVDNSGNNNLDLEQKKIIENYFSNKSNKNKNVQNNFKRRTIRRIPTQICHDHKSFLNRIYRLSSTIENNTKTTKDKKKIAFHKSKKNSISKELKLKTGFTKIKENIFEENDKILNSKKTKSNKNNNNFFVINDKNNDIEKEVIQNENIEKNSIFENDNSSSFNSSFLGSSFDDDFYKNLNKN